AGRAADFLDQLRRVALVMPAQDLEDAILVLQCGILLGPRSHKLAHLVAERLRRLIFVGIGLLGRRLAGFTLVAPFLVVVFLPVGVNAGKDAGQFVVVCVFEFLGDQRRSVRVMD